VPSDSDEQDVGPGERFAALIRRARNEAGVSQEELAEETGISRSQLIRWESGKVERPDPEAVRAVCSVLWIDPREAVVALGFLTRQEAFPPVKRLSPTMSRVIKILQGEDLTSVEKQLWIDYLIYLSQRGVGAKVVKEILEQHGKKPLRRIPKSPLPPGPGAVGGKRLLRKDTPPME